MARISGRHAALLMVDLINHFEFPGGEALLENAGSMVRPLLSLRRRAHAAGVPVIYANDNFDDWHSDSSLILKRCLRRGCRGARFTRSIAPQRRDYFVLKPANSGFYGTTLETMLRALEVEHLIIAGSVLKTAYCLPRTTRTCVGTSCTFRRTAWHLSARATPSARSNRCG